MNHLENIKKCLKVKKNGVKQEVRRMKQFFLLKTSSYIFDDVFAEIRLFKVKISLIMIKGFINSINSLIFSDLEILIKARV